MIGGIVCQEKKTQGKIAFENGLGFQARVEEVHLKYCILGDASKNKTSEEVLVLSEKFRPPAEFGTFTSAAKGCLKDCSLLGEMMPPDSINGIYIETFPIIGE